MDRSTQDWPRLTPDAPQLTGRLKTTPEDFVVEEVPAYLPAGAGEHLFLWIEKRDLSAEQLLRHVARTLDIDQRDIGCAGMKDRRAVTRQWLSVPARAADRLPELASPQIRVLEHALHGNKLRQGHLQGNRFTIVIRDAACAGGDVAAVAAAVAQRLQSNGFPNYFGEQRFGREGDTLQLGRDLLAGRKTPKDIPYSRRRFLLKLSLSAVQSDLFNQALAARLTDGLLQTVLAGDVMEVVQTGGKFLAEDPAREQPRCDAGETAITGPMFGPKMRSPTGVPAEREARLLESAGLTLDAFRGFGDLVSGTRRPYVIRPGDCAVTQVADGLECRFTLPPGVYATTLLRELVHVQADETDAPTS